MKANISSGFEAPLQLRDSVGVPQILGRRWTLHILARLNSSQAMRFTELKRSMPGISGTMLSKRLSELEGEGMITRKIHASVPARVEYALTEAAIDLVRILQDLCVWRARWNSNKHEAPVMNPVFVAARQ